MKLEAPGWLKPLLTEALHASVEERPVPSGGTQSSRGRTFLHQALRLGGLLERPFESTSDGQLATVLRGLVQLARGLAEQMGHPTPRVEQVAILLAFTAGELELAEELQLRLAARPAPFPLKLWARVEEAIARRARSLTSDPYYGLILHSGALQLDAQLFGHQAIDLFLHDEITPRRAARRARFTAAQKATLVEVLNALACAERRPTFPARKAVFRQIGDLGLTPEADRRLRQRIRRSFEQRPALAEIVREVRSEAFRRFLLEQAMLASLVDGQRSARELRFLRELAELLHIPPDALVRLEVEVAGFYARNRQAIDVFSIESSEPLVGAEMIDSLQGVLERNLERVLLELRQTGELSIQLARVARGHTLTAAEKRRMREQLLDVAKVIPALAIFAAPGGLLLLIGLAKVLPFNVLPSAFQGSSDDDYAPGPES
jgi:hypothetical protein